MKKIRAYNLIDIPSSLPIDLIKYYIFLFEVQPVKFGQILPLKSFNLPP